MKLMIEIPEEDYKNGTLINYFKCYSTELDKIIYQGTPLPKGHGRLGDLDKFESEMYHKAFETDTDLQKWDSGCWIRYKMFENAIANAQTIIEADKEE